MLWYFRKDDWAWLPRFAEGTLLLFGWFVQLGFWLLRCGQASKKILIYVARQAPSPHGGKRPHHMWTAEPSTSGRSDVLMRKKRSLWSWTAVPGWSFLHLSKLNSWTCPSDLFEHFVQTWTRLYFCSEIQRIKMRISRGPHNFFSDKISFHERILSFWCFLVIPGTWNSLYGARMNLRYDGPEHPFVGGDTCRTIDSFWASKNRLWVQHIWGQRSQVVLNLARNVNRITGLAAAAAYPSHRLCTKIYSGVWLEWGRPMTPPLLFRPAFRSTDISENWVLLHYPGRQVEARTNMGWSMSIHLGITFGVETRVSGFCPILIQACKIDFNWFCQATQFQIRSTEQKKVRCCSTKLLAEIILMCYPLVN